MKLQIVTDVLIESYNPEDLMGSYGFRVTKEPRPEGRYKIEFRPYCTFALGECAPRPELVTRAFYHYVKTGEDLLLGDPNLRRSLGLW